MDDQLPEGWTTDQFEAELEAAWVADVPSGGVVMDGRCATCRWWLTEQEVTETQDESWRDCALTFVRNGDEPVYPESLSRAVDWGSYQAVLETHRDFGCVQYAEKYEHEGAPV